MKKIKFCVLSALTLTFIGLKLADKIDWSWWLVLSPMWIFAILIAIRLVTILCLYCLDKDYREAINEYRASRKQGNHRLPEASQRLADRLEEIKQARLEKWERESNQS
jgi:hypothetical protein